MEKNETGNEKPTATKDPVQVSDRKNECGKGLLEPTRDFSGFLKCIGRTAFVQFTGFVGSIDGDIVLLYPTLDPTQYYEIPTESILYVRKISCDPEKRLEVFVKASAEVRSVHVDQYERPTVPISAHRALSSRTPCSVLANICISYKNKLAQTTDPVKQQELRNKIQGVNHMMQLGGCGECREGS